MADSQQPEDELETNALDSGTEEFELNLDSLTFDEPSLDGLDAPIGGDELATDFNELAEISGIDDLMLEDEPLRTLDPVPRSRAAAQERAAKAVSEAAAAAAASETALFDALEPEDEQEMMSEELVEIEEEEPEEREEPEGASIEDEVSVVFEEEEAAFVDDSIVFEVEDGDEEMDAIFEEMEMDDHEAMVEDEATEDVAAVMPETDETETENEEVVKNVEPLDTVAIVDSPKGVATMDDDIVFDDDDDDDDDDDVDAIFEEIEIETDLEEEDVIEVPVEMEEEFGGDIDDLILAEEEEEVEEEVLEEEVLEGDELPEEMDDYLELEEDDEEGDSVIVQASAAVAAAASAMAGLAAVKEKPEPLEDIVLDDVIDADASAEAVEEAEMESLMDLEDDLEEVDVDLDDEIVAYDFQKKPDTSAKTDTAPAKEWEEDIEITKDKSPVEGKGSKKLSPVELGSLILIGVLCLAGVYIFQHSVATGLPKYDGPVVGEEVPSSLKGESIGISNIDAYWRDKLPTDRVDPDSVALPALLVKVESGSGYLQMLMRDETGALRGDSITVRLKDGVFESSGTDEMELLGTLGFINQFIFAEYRSIDNREFWSVTLRESPDNEKWREMATFEMPTTYKHE